jgi:hypothetical protein
MDTPLSVSDIEAVRRDRRGNAGNRVRVFSNVFPYLLVPVVLYNLVALFAGGADATGQPAMAGAMGGVAFGLPMLSGVTMNVTWGDVMVVFAIMFLFIEVIKSTSTASSSIVNHIVSMGLFILCLVEFLLWESFATGTFFLITMIVLLDALAGMVVTIVSARRDFGVEGMGS